MTTCPEGHSNPAHWEFCGECGAPIDEAAEKLEAQAWVRAKWAVTAMAVFAVLVMAAAVIAFVATRESATTSSSGPVPANAVAIREWWSLAQQPFTELQQSLDDAQDALSRADGPALKEACQQMHDMAHVELRALLPTSDPWLTGEVQAATEDAHTSAHMCLAVAAGSMNSYSGEFTSNLDQARRHLLAAQALIKKALTTTV